MYYKAGQGEMPYIRKANAMTRREDNHMLRKHVVSET
jgi:hypothetical protein